MKLTSNNYLFSNFNLSYLTESTSKNNLSINNIYNLSVKSNYIEPVSNFSSLLESYFDKTFIDKLNIESSEILNNIYHLQPFDYLDKNLNIIKTRYFIVDTDNNLYEINEIENCIINLNIKFKKNPEFLIYNEKLYIYSHNDLFLLINQDNYPITLTDIINFTSVHQLQNLTVFCCLENKFSIYYCDSTDIENLESSLNTYNEIKLCPENGEIEKLIIYKNNIYVVQKYAISKIIIQEDKFNIQNTYSIKSSIIPNTIEIIDDYVIFLSNAGLYIFDGNDTKQLFKNETINLIKNNLKSISYNNKYYLMCKYYINNLKEDLILEFDIENEHCTFYKLENLLDIYLIKTHSSYKLAIVTTSKSVDKIKFLDFNNICSYQKYIKFNKLTFDETPVKILNEIKIISHGSYFITITSEIQTATFEINGVSYIRNIGIKGQAFEIEIKSNSSFKIEAIYLKTTSYTED